MMQQIKVKNGIAQCPKGGACFFRDGKCIDCGGAEPTGVTRNGGVSGAEVYRRTESERGD